MKYEDLSKFTNNELTNFTHEGLARDISDLLKSLQSENPAIPVATYEKLKALADRYNVQMPDRPKHGLTKKFIAIFLVSVFQACAAYKGTPIVSVTVNINCSPVEVSIEEVKSMPATDELISSLCEKLKNQTE